MKLKAELKENMEDIFNLTLEWINNQTEKNLNHRHYFGKWTAAQHVYHLIKSSKALSSTMQLPKDNILKLFGNLDREQYGYPILVKKYEDLLATGPIAGKQFSSDIDRMFTKSELLQRLKGEFQEMLQITSEWTEDDLSTYVIPHPILGKFSVREMIYFTIFHTKHHYKALANKYSEKKEEN